MRVKESRCTRCGCTDSRACVTESGPCHWVRVDRKKGVGLSSGCAPRRPASLPPPESFVDRPHGTRLRYLSGCRCVPCRAANSRYETERAAARKRGEHGRIVSASRARRHLKNLSRQGVGYKTVAAASDVGRTIIAGIKSGRRPRIRASTERRILAVDASARADHSIVETSRTWRRIARLLEEGFTKTELARRLGSRARTPALQLGRERVLARNALRVQRLYRLVME